MSLLLQLAYCTSLALFRGLVSVPESRKENRIAQNIHSFNEYIVKKYGKTYNILLMPFFDGMTFVQR